MCYKSPCFKFKIYSFEGVLLVGFILWSENNDQEALDSVINKFGIPGCIKHGNLDILRSVAQFF